VGSRSGSDGLIPVDQAHRQEPTRPISRFLVISGWVATILGIVLWTYGYFVAGTPALVPWTSFLPSWASEWLPNLESEIAMVLVIMGSVPLYWDMLRSQ
jgi:hypothetical protein